MSRREAIICESLGIMLVLGLTLIMPISYTAGQDALPSKYVELIPDHIKTQIKYQGGHSMFLTADKLGVQTIMDKSLSSGISSGDSPPTDAIRNVGIATHPTKHENEPTVVANPKNPKNLVAGSHFFGPPPPFENRCVAFSSFDGGMTWSGPILMPRLTSESSSSDPVLAFAPDGSRVYYAYIDIKFIFTPSPDTFTIDFDIVMSYSDNGGVTWTGPIVALDGKPTIIVFSPFSVEEGFMYDKCWIGTHVNGNSDWVYVTATRFDNFFPYNIHIAFAQSRDKGQFWNPPTLLDTGTYPIVVQGSRPTGGKGNDVIVSWYHSGSDGFLSGNFNIRTRYSSDNGATWDSSVNAAVDSFELPYWLGPFGFYHRWWGSMLPDVEIDSNGIAHIVYTHDPVASSNTAEDGNIRYISSSGPPYKVWTSPVTLNDDGLSRAQGYAAIETSQISNGDVILHVIWEDHRLNPELPPSFPDSSNFFYDIFYTRRGINKEWHPNRRITDKSSISDSSFIGDYNDITASGGLAFGVWTDRRHQPRIFDSEDNVFGSRIVIPILGVESKFTAVDLKSVFTINVKVEDAIDLAGFQFDLKFNPQVLEVIDVTEGNFLKVNNGNTNFISPKLNNSEGLISGTLNIRASSGGVESSGLLAKAKFIAKGKGDSLITLQNVILSDSSAQKIPHLLKNGRINVNPFPAWDINQDNVVNLLDFVIVGQNFGRKEGEIGFNPRADVNRDGIVDIFDLILIAQHFLETTASAAPPIALENLNPEQVIALEKLYQIMDKMPNSDPEFIRTKALLRELILLAPNKIAHTKALQNFPNPFNPETWIPYELAENAKVTITIYNALGQLVRTIDFGEKLRGSYVSKEAAAYWDGRNEFGESVAGGVYFYRLQAGKFSAVKKMILIK